MAAVTLLNLSTLPLRELEQTLGKVLKITRDEKVEGRVHVVAEELRVLELVKERKDAVDWLLSLTIVGDAIATWPDAIRGE
jgi:hypothetical protein